MNDPGSPIKPPVQAGPTRRAFHTLVALAGWAFFIYWWWIVLHRVSPHEVRFTALFIVVSLAIVVAATVLWVWHNRRIFRRKGERKQVRRSQADFSHDGVGRNVAFPAAGDDIRTAAIVSIRVPGMEKRYETPERIPPVLVPLTPVPTPIPSPRPLTRT